MATAWQKRFGSAARKCSGKSGRAFRSCMRSKLKGGKSRSRRRGRGRGRCVMGPHGRCRKRRR